MAEREYLGPHPTVLDEAGRITIPRRFREIMEDKEHLNWTVTRGYDANLYLYNRDQWQKLVDYAEGLHPLDPKAQRLLRTIYGCALSVTVDRQGRMPIPSALRELAKLDREVVLVGMRDHLELWNKEAWAAFQASAGPEMGTLAAELLVSGGPSRVINTVGG